SLSLKILEIHRVFLRIFAEADGSQTRYGFKRYIFADTASEMLEMRQHFSAFFLVSTKIYSLKTSQNLKENILRAA
ncbi:MAG: hypothetical protein ACI4SB_00220, partial [Acutalibacteraceae bacterium]